jgi:hypothetical protein
MAMIKLADRRRKIGESLIRLIYAGGIPKPREWISARLDISECTLEEWQNGKTIQGKKVRSPPAAPIGYMIELVDAYCFLRAAETKIRISSPALPTKPVEQSLAKTIFANFRRRKILKLPDLSTRAFEFTLRRTD